MRTIALAVGLAFFALAIRNFYILYRHWRNNNKKVWINGTYQNEVHTLPLNDEIEHKAVDCPCNPQTIPVELEDGGVNWQVIHNAKDGRE